MGIENLENVLAVLTALWVIGCFTLPSAIVGHSLETMDGIARYAKSLTRFGQVGTIVLVVLFLPSIVLVAIIYSASDLVEKVKWYKE